MKYLIFVKATADSEAGVLPTLEAMQNMGRFNEELANDGMLVAAEGLRPSSKGTRVHVDGSRATTTDGPFAETKELIAGFWIVEAPSRDAVVKRFSQAPFDRPTTIEVREFFQMEDFAGLISPEDAETYETVNLDQLKAAPPA